MSAACGVLPDKQSYGMLAAKLWFTDSKAMGYRQQSYGIPMLDCRYQIVILYYQKMNWDMSCRMAANYM